MNLERKTKRIRNENIFLSEDHRTTVRTKNKQMEKVYQKWAKRKVEVKSKACTLWEKNFEAYRKTRNW